MGQGSAGELPSEGGPTEADIRAQLARILASAGFRGAVRRREFLRFIVEETLAGRRERLRGVAIASAVFGRDETFDPELDPIVRSEARHLRRDLDGYYAGEGRDDPVHIRISEDGYVPVFEPRPTVAPTQAEPHAASPDSGGVTRRLGQPHTSRLLVTGLFVLAFAIILAQVVALIWSDPVEETPPPKDPALFIPRAPAVAILPSGGVYEQPTTELAQPPTVGALALARVNPGLSGQPSPEETRRRPSPGARLLLAP